MNENRFSTSQPENSTSDIDEYLQGLEASGTVLVSIIIILIVIWVWSMIAIINLNGRFKKFFSEFQRYVDDREGMVDSDKATTSSETNLNDDGNQSGYNADK